MACVAGFVSRYNLSDRASQDLLKLIQLHLPPTNIAETKLADIKRKCGFERSDVKYSMYCTKCKGSFSKDEECSTEGCGGTMDERHFFAQCNVNLQLKEILEREGVWEGIVDSRSGQQPQNICDITSGRVYKDLREGGVISDSSITLSFFTDGVPLFSSSQVSLWPVFLTVNELQAEARYQPKNLIIWGLWQGKGKPPMNVFLDKLVEDLQKLFTEGVEVVVGEAVLQVKALLICAIMDLPARADVLAMSHHNGEFPCVHCKIPGETVDSGAGRCRSFTNTDYEARTQQSIRQDAENALRNGVRHNGFRGMSVLLHVPHFDFTKNVGIDYMHGVLLGVVKKLLELWFDTKYSDKDFFVKKQDKEQINKRLRQVKPPYVVHRKPRDLGQVSHWKASEYRNWLLFYSIPCLTGFLKEKYLCHFSKLVEAVYLLLGQGITRADLDRARELLAEFAKEFGHYGQNCLSLNVHHLTHLVTCVENLGPLWAFSAFGYESLNGEIKKPIHGTGNACHQIVWGLWSLKTVLTRAESLKSESAKMFIRDMFDTSKVSSGQAGFQCKVLDTKEVQKPFTEGTRHALTEAGLEHSEDGYLSVGRVLRGGRCFHSKSATRAKLEISYNVALHMPLQNCIGLEVENFLQHKQTGKVYAVGRCILRSEHVRGSVLHGRCPHIQPVTIGDLTVLGVEHLDDLFCVMKTSQIFVSRFPNHIESD